MAKAAAAKKLTPLGAVKGATLGLIGVVGLMISAVGPFRVPFAESLAKDHFRQAVTGLVLVVVLVAGLITAVVKLFDPNQFKDRMVRYVHERTQRDLVLDGELSMRYFPKLGLESGKASLSQRRSAREFAAVDKARVTFAWLDLLRGRVHIDSAEIEGLRAQVVRFKDGSTNIDDLAKDFMSVAPGSIDVDSLRLTRASLQWNDELFWQRGSLNELQVEVGRIADGVAGPLSASARIDAAGAGVDARLQLKGRVMFDSTAGRIELARIESRLEGKAFGVDNLALLVKGDVSGLPRERALAIDNVLASSMHKSGLTVFNIVLAAPELKLSDYRVSGTALAVEASVRHPDRSTTLAVKVPRFEWAEHALRDTTAQAQLTLKKADAQLRAQLSSPLALLLDGGARIELAAMDMAASATHPALAAEVAMQLKGRLDIDLAQQTARASWTGQVAGGDAKAELAVADFVNRPRWTVDAEIARLDVDALLSNTWLAHWGDDATPFDAAMLREANVQGRVRVAQAKLGGLRTGAAQARFELDKSVLSVAPITAQAYGAQLEAAFVLDATAAPRISAKGSLNEVDLRAMMADVAHTPWLEGRGAVTWDLNSGGASVGTLRNSLAGVLNLSARGGALAGVDLRAALLDGRAELGKRATAQPRDFDATAKTPFSDMKLRFDLREGRASGQGIELNAAAIHAAGEGDLRLDSGALDLRLHASVGKGTHELASLAGVSVPMQVQGTWRAPRFAFDYGAATGPGVVRATDVADAPLALVKTSTPASPGERALGPK